MFADQRGLVPQGYKRTRAISGDWTELIHLVVGEKSGTTRLLQASKSVGWNRQLEYASKRSQSKIRQVGAVATVSFQSCLLLYLPTCMLFRYTKYAGYM